MMFMTFASSYFLAVRICRRRFSVQLVCLPMDFNHGKFQPSCVSHREAARRSSSL